jgi:hypothetical protein
MNALNMEDTFRSGDDGSSAQADPGSVLPSAGLTLTYPYCDPYDVLYI